MERKYEAIKASEFSKKLHEKGSSIQKRTDEAYVEVDYKNLIQ